jgi:hypothetical protein
MLNIESPDAPNWEKTGGVWDPQIHMMVRQEDESKVQEILDRYAPFLQAHFLQPIGSQTSLELQYESDKVAKIFLKEFKKATGK